MSKKPAIVDEKEQDRVRQARRRKRMRAAGRPLTHVVDRVLLEALSFEMARTPIEIGSVSVERIMKTARKILVRREGYDRTACEAAIKGRLAPRAEHCLPDNIPSLHPLAGVPLADRVRSRAEQMISGL